MAPSKSATDSCAEDTTTEAINTLESTVGTFATRINRKLREKEELNDVSAKLREARHALMLQAMTTIRKALQETCKVKLGERFYFDMIVSDWEGWPRVDLNLVDSVAPARVDYSLIVTANDRNDRGTVKIATKSGEILGQVQLANGDEFKRLPLILKRSVRQFLDVVAAYVLNPPAPEEMLETLAKPLEDVDPEQDAIAAALLNEDVFCDDARDYKENLIDIDDHEAAPVEEELTREQTPQDDNLVDTQEVKPLSGVLSLID
ncbi:MAG: hypothetical protein D6719_12125 [Candidatus Dadabacteria bacterium]|nr:MAG: hypothetical protein D6719_12125 [Candidatus Dadabacteria bacterium]